MANDEKIDFDEAEFDKFQIMQYWHNQKTKEAFDGQFECEKYVKLTL